MKNAQVITDGRELRFPKWTDHKSVKQSKDAAMWLSQWLHRETGERIFVRPLLVIPGWYVTRNAPAGENDVVILNEKQIKGYIRGRTSANKPLPPKQMERIINKLEEKSRDVEPQVSRYDK